VIFYSFVLVHKIENQMKKIFIFLGLLGFLASGCSDYLEEENLSNIGAEEYYKTSDGYETLVNAAYSSLRDIYGPAPWMFCAGTDMYVEGRQSQPVGLSEYRLDLSTAHLPSLSMRWMNALVN
jgi:hypothetical protein